MKKTERTVYVIAANFRPVVDINFNINTYNNYEVAKQQYDYFTEDYGKYFSDHNTIKKVTIIEEEIDQAEQ